VNCKIEVSFIWVEVVAQGTYGVRVGNFFFASVLHTPDDGF